MSELLEEVAQATRGACGDLIMTHERAQDRERSLHKNPKMDLVRGWLRQAQEALSDNKPVMAFYYLQQIQEELHDDEARRAKADRNRQGTDGLGQ